MMKAPTDFLAICMSGYVFLGLASPSPSQGLRWSWSACSVLPWKQECHFFSFRKNALLPATIILIKYFEEGSYNDNCSDFSTGGCIALGLMECPGCLSIPWPGRRLSTNDFHQCYVVLSSAFPSGFCDLRFQKDHLVSKNWGKEGTLLQLFHVLSNSLHSFSTRHDFFLAFLLLPKEIKKPLFPLTSLVRWNSSWDLAFLVSSHNVSILFLNYPTGMHLSLWVSLSSGRGSFHWCTPGASWFTCALWDSPSQETAKSNPASY